MRKIILFLFVSCAFVMIPEIKSWAVDDVARTETKPASNIIEEKSEDGKTTLTMSALDAVKLAGNLVDAGDYEHATQILTMMPDNNSLPVEIERWYLLAQIAQRQGEYDTAIKIYRKILDDQPDLIKVRYELALCYMEKGQWYRADYHLRLAMAGDDIPLQAKQAMMYYRWIARQNKNWNVWFNFGAAPDTNVNQAKGGKECIVNEWGMFCRKLPEPERVIGANLTLGGNYEFKLSDHWRWKNEANIYTNIYDKHIYDDLYLSAATGPRYVWNRGDVWLAATGGRRWYGWDKYNWSAGVKLDTNYDFTRKMSSGLSLRVMDNKYDEYGDYMDGETYSAYPYLVYSFDASKYIMLRGDFERTTAKSDAYANWRYGASIGFGSELPYGFNLYFEPYFSWTDYDGDKWIVKHNTYQPVTEHNFIQRYSVSVANNKLDFWGFVPTVIVAYTKKHSNIHSREYEKWTTEFTLRQRF